MASNPPSILPSILIVEDEPHLAEGLRFNLEMEGYRTRIARDAESALTLLLGDSARYDAVILDVMLPDIDGFEVVTRLRAAGNYVPVLMLTARSRPEDLLRGFEAGADDYLPKPFELTILLARLHGLLRRREWLLKGHQPGLYRFSGRTIDFNNLELHARGEVIRLTQMEADLLRYLIRHEGEAVSRKAILEEVWGMREDTDTRAIDNFIVRLRKYIEDEPASPRHLLTVRGIGYRFIAEPTVAP